MFWYSLIAQCLGLKRDVLQTNDAKTATREENHQHSSTAKMEFYRQANETQSINPNEELYDLSRAINLPSTPPSTPIEEAIPPLTSLTTPDLLPSDLLIGVYNRESGTVSFQGSTKILQFRATVLLKKYALRAYGPLPPTADREVGVVFNFTNFKVWSVYVVVPYKHVKSQLPETLPELPSPPKVDC